MRQVSVLFIKSTLVGLLAYAGLLVNSVLAQGINQPRVIENAKLAECLNRIGQSMMHDGVAQVPFTIKFEVSGDAASGQQAKTVSDPAIAACIDLLAQNSVRTGSARIPFVIRVTTGH